MTVSRRKFLRAGTMLTLSAALPLSLTSLAVAQKRKALPIGPDRPAVPLAAQQNPLYHFTRDTFTPYVNSIFTVNAVPWAEIVLVEVKETPLVVAKGSTRIPTGECFTLVFRGPNRTRFRQDTYTFDHPALGKFEMFITPTDRPSKQQYYTAVINRRQ